MTDEANRLYGGIPERLYIIHDDDRIAYRGKIGPWGYNLKEVEAWLENYKDETQRKQD